MQDTALSRPAAYSYIRMSTNLQLKGDSRRRQLELSEQYARENGLELVADFQLEDIGISAFKGANLAAGSALGAFLQAIRGGKIPTGSYLLVESLDRLSRQDVFSSLSLFTEIIKSGVNIVTLADRQTYAAGQTDFSQLVLSLAIMSRAHEESRTKSYRLSEAWTSKRRNVSRRKLTAQCPAWLSLTADKESFIVLEDRAAIVQRIFEESASGIGNYSIARRLNKAGVQPFGRSQGWQISYINKILTNRAVLGEFQPHRLFEGRRMPEGTAIPGYFPQVVSEELFLRAQAGRTQRRISGTGRKGYLITNLFSGLARCAYCRGPMHLLNKGHGPKGGTYLVCDTANRGLGCERTSWRYDDFETSFLAFVEELDLEPLVRSEHDADERRKVDQALQALSGQISQLQRQRERTYTLLMEEEVVSDYLKQELIRCERELAAATDRLTQLESERREFAANALRVYDSKEQIKGLIQRLRHGSQEDVYRLRAQVAARLKALVTSVTVATAGQRPLIEKAIRELADSGGEDVGSVRVQAALQTDATSMRAAHRYFSVSFKDGSLRIVHPGASDPLVAERQIYGSQQEFIRMEADGLPEAFLKSKTFSSKGLS